MATQKHQMQPEHEPPPDEFSRRILYSLLQPALELAADEGLELKELGHWAETGYFHVLRERGLKMREMSDLLSVSMRKVAGLSKQLKENFLAPEKEVALPRRIEFILWAEPLSRSRLAQVMTDVDESELDEALEILLEEERITLNDDERYDIASPTRRIVGRTWMGKIDGLNNLMRSVYEVVQRRLFDDDERAFARTLNLRVRPEDLERLHKLYEEEIWSELAALDEAARDHEDAVPIDFSVFWTPSDEDTE